MKRKLHAKKMLEEEKRMTIEKILNVYIFIYNIIGRWKKIKRKAKKIK
jgi:hypothetical protein